MTDYGADPWGAGIAARVKCSPDTAVRASMGYGCGAHADKNVRAPRLVGRKEIAP
jgi:hypothetical protein